MRLRLTKEFRIKVAALVAVLYAVCVITPSVVLAFAGGSVAPCLFEAVAETSLHHHDHATNQHAAHQHAAHEHAAAEHDPQAIGGAAHDTSEHDQKGHAPTCCNLFPAVGIPGDATFVLARLSAFRAELPALEDALRGRGPDGISRPPIA